MGLAENGKTKESYTSIIGHLRRLALSMRTRRQTVEHPFGTLKDWMGATHFLTRSLDRVSTEMSLHVLAYNMKRVMKIMCIGELKAAIQA